MLLSLGHFLTTIWGLPRVRFGLLCLSAYSDQAKNLHTVYKLSALHCLFSSFSRTNPRAHVFGSREHVHAMMKLKICIPS